MDYRFLSYCKEKAKSGWTEQEKQAYDSIINILFRMKLFGKQKARQIDEYDGESMFGKTTLYPGQIYAFIYQAEKPTIYDDGKTKFEYYDKLPIVLITHVNKGMVRGINLNLCNFTVKTYILNALHNLDLEFYERKNLEMANKGQAPISNNVARVFLNSRTEKAFIEHIKNECRLKNTGILYRQYSVENMKFVRMIEIWQHKYIPFLTYTGELKKEVLGLIHKVVGLDNVKL